MGGAWQRCRGYPAVLLEPDGVESAGPLTGVEIRCQTQPAAVMAARLRAPFATLDASERAGCGLTSWSYVSASSDLAGRDRFRRSGTGTHRET